MQCVNCKDFFCEIKIILYENSFVFFFIFYLCELFCLKYDIFFRVVEKTKSPKVHEPSEEDIMKVNISFFLFKCNNRVNI